MLAKRPIGECVELTGFNVGFKLSVPNLCVEFDKPLPKFCELVRRKFFYLALKYFDFAHMSPH